MHELNGGVSLAKVQDVHMQKNYLVAEAKDIKGLHFHNDCKVLTIMIGTGSLCISCEHARTGATPELFEDKYRTITERVGREIPKVNALYTRVIHSISCDYAAKNYSDFVVMLQPRASNTFPCLRWTT